MVSDTSKMSLDNSINPYEDDLKMRSAMYDVLFQAFIDKVHHFLADSKST